ncbi:hypothetical protein [Schleiferilactobacillus harbinensis]|uniref:Uncharacterized protein n=1 Tax=Schleiferilactobacillus harbinensis TaxID=304207 RepID=A0ABU7T3P7_9LACO
MSVVAAIATITTVLGALIGLVIVATRLTKALTKLCFAVSALVAALRVFRKK